MLRTELKFGVDRPPGRSIIHPCSDVLIRTNHTEQTSCDKHTSRFANHEKVKGLMLNRQQSIHHTTSESRYETKTSFCLQRVHGYKISRFLYDLPFLTIGGGNFAKLLRFDYVALNYLGQFFFVYSFSVSQAP